METVIEANATLYGYPTLSVRDALHATFMKKRGITSLLSFDAGFDQLPFIERIS
ncbi:MAG: type II toxin-antitoxin system VapC family toxin [Fimbriimonadaceae bacterium]